MLCLETLLSLQPIHYHNNANTLTQTHRDMKARVNSSKLTRRLLSIIRGKTTDHGAVTIYTGGCTTGTRFKHSRGRQYFDTKNEEYVDKSFVDMMQDDAEGRLKVEAEIDLEVRAGDEHAFTDELQDLIEKYAA